MQRRILALCLVVSTVVCPALYAAETCTTQSQMKPAERDGLAGAARTLAVAIAGGSDDALRGGSTAELQSDFASVTRLAAATATHVRGATPEVEQIYVLDASTLSKTAAGANPDAQFFCTLNQTVAEADFTIPQLPPGKYGFAMVRFEAAQPYRVSMLLRQDGGQWKLAGFYPKALSADGHDGKWFWTEARTLEAAKQPWTAWLYLQEARVLLTPAAFVSSTHLQKLNDELTAATPPAIAGGLSADTPLVLKGANGDEVRVTGLAVDDSLGADRLDVTERIKAEALGDGDTARKRNAEAAAALLAAHPELRKAFHGVLVLTDVPGAAPFATELAMGEIH